MKLLDRIEKSKAFWSLFWISLIFFLLRFPSIFEPNWYGDEGIYQVIGIAINNGSILYSQIWDNKPPLLYLTYALFNGDQSSVRIASLFIGLFSTWAFFYLCEKVFQKLKVSIISTFLFAILFAIPLIEGNIANAENFMLLPIITAAILIYNAVKDQRQKTKYLLSAGLLLGIAFLFKIVAIFDLAAFLCFIFITNLITEKISRKVKILVYDSFLIILGFLTPVLITAIYFALNNSLIDFMRATFLGNIAYVGYANKLIFPQGFLILKLLLLAISIMIIYSKRKKFSKPTIFILLWFSFSLFNALFSQRPYTHYLLVLLPSFCLLVGTIFNNRRVKPRQILLFSFLIGFVLLSTTFKVDGLRKTFLYYPNAFLFITGKKDVKSYQAFFDEETPRDYDIASFIRMHTKPNDQILIWGDSAQIYVLSHTRPINKYTVAYHTRQSKQALEETQQALDTVKPKYVIILPESKNFPFQLINYVNKISFNKATIYERSF